MAAPLLRHSPQNKYGFVLARFFLYVAVVFNNFCFTFLTTFVSGTLFLFLLSRRRAERRGLELSRNINPVWYIDNCRPCNYSFLLGIACLSLHISLFLSLFPASVERARCEQSNERWMMRSLLVFSCFFSMSYSLPRKTSYSRNRFALLAVRRPGSVKVTVEPGDACTYVRVGASLLRHGRYWTEQNKPATFLPALSLTQAKIEDRVRLSRQWQKTECKGK